MYDLINPPRQTGPKQFIQNRPHTTTKIKGWTKLSFEKDQATLFGNRTDFCVYTHPTNHLSITFKLSNHNVNLEIYARDICVERVKQLAPKLHAAGNKRPDLVTVSTLPAISSFEHNTYVLVNNSSGVSLYFANTERQCYTLFTPRKSKKDPNGYDLQAFLHSLVEAKLHNDEAGIGILLGELIAWNRRLSDNPKWSDNQALQKTTSLSNDSTYHIVTFGASETPDIKIETENDACTYAKLITSMDDVALALGLPIEIKNELIAMINGVKEDFLKYHLSLLSSLTTKDEEVMSLLPYELKQMRQTEFDLEHTIRWLIDKNEPSALFCLVRPLMDRYVVHGDSFMVNAYIFVLENDRSLFMSEKSRITNEIAVLKKHSHNGTRFYSDIQLLTGVLEYVQQAEKCHPINEQPITVGSPLQFTKAIPATQESNSGLSLQCKQ